MTYLWGVIIFCAGTVAPTGLFWWFIRNQQNKYDREIAELEQRMSVLAPIWGDERK